MNLNFKEPAVMLSIAIIFIGLALLVWAVPRLFKKKAPDESPFPDTELPPAGGDDLFQPGPAADFNPSPLPEMRSAPARETPAAAAPAGGKEMVDRLDNMAQRLSDMQTVLQRQAASAPAGTPLTPETIDKLLKIIGNVSQQVDILQKNLGATPTAPAPAQTTRPPTPTPAPMPASAHAPAPTPAPIPAPAPAPVSSTPPAARPGGLPPAAKPATTPPPAATPPPAGKGLGIAGGALSNFPRPTPPPVQKPGAEPPK